MRYLVTGGAGFIGSNFIHYILEKSSENEVINLDALTYAGRLDNLKKVENNGNYQFVKGSINDLSLVKEQVNKVDIVVNFAAESHVDRSINSPLIFSETNVMGTHALLEAAKEADTKLFFHVSTDEVYGSIKDGSFTEESPLDPSSPYSATKTGSDLLVKSYNKTFGLPVIISRCSNNYGPYQHPEKLIPHFIKRLMNNQKVPVYGTGQNVREWIHVKDHCMAIDHLIEKGTKGEVYNIGSGEEKTNLELTKLLLNLFDKGEEMIEYVSDRLGHDWRYSIDSSKLRKTDWKPQISFEKGISDTVNWYKDNEKWLNH
jgi:dTDP-glucose 4,6-dehydratase